MKTKFQHDLQDKAKTVSRSRFVFSVLEKNAMQKKKKKNGEASFMYQCAEVIQLVRVFKTSRFTQLPYTGVVPNGILALITSHSSAVMKLDVSTGLKSVRDSTDIRRIMALS